MNFSLKIGLPLLLMAAGVSCREDSAGHQDQTSAPIAAKEKPLVACTTTMICDQAKQVGGDFVRVVGIMKPAVNPHAYEPTPNDGILLRKADLILVNGLHLEGRMLDMIGGAEEKVIKLAEDPVIKPRMPAGGNAPDPHVWWNALYFARYVERTKDAFVKLDPEHRLDYERNAASYIERLRKTHERIKAAFARVSPEKRLMITSHDAFYYYGEAYGITVDAVLGISAEAQEKAGEPLRLASLVSSRKIPAVFHETSVSPAQNGLIDSIQRLAKMKFGIDVKIAGPLFSDSLGEPGQADGEYIGAIESNTKIIIAALTGAAADDWLLNEPASPTK
jgi:manganese/zinc/iron transport system substrate-binding protein